MSDETLADFVEKQPLVVKCNQCGVDHEVMVDPYEYQRWQDGELIQKAMPGLTPDERELLISGTCGSCFDEMFPEEHEGPDPGPETMDDLPFNR